MEPRLPGSGDRAVLVWLKEGLEPRSGLFESKPEEGDLGPVCWIRFDLALLFAMHDPRTDERVPWIKTGGRVIRPSALREMFVADKAA